MIKKNIFNFLFRVFLICFCIIGLSVSTHISVKASNYENEIEKSLYDYDFCEDSINVVLKPKFSKFNTIQETVLFKLSSLDNVLSVENVLEFSSDVANENGTLNIDSNSEVIKHLSEIDYKQVLKVSLKEKSKENVIDLINEIIEIEEVLYAEPNYKFNPLSIPNDPYLSEQWNLIGDNGINMQESWEFSIGSNEIRVGVIDTGVSMHNDLSNNLAPGYDFYNGNSVTDDDNYNHGTSVAGIIGAVGNNCQGVTGINQNVTIVPMQIFDYVNGELFVDNDKIIDSIEYATRLWDTEERISILNYSVSGFGINRSLLPVIETYPGLFVWAAGNMGENLDLIPDIENFSIENILSVGAHDKYNERSIWSDEFSSSYGHIVNIYAPGGKSSFATNENCYTLSSISSDSYQYFNGTSCAAPHVSGVASLLLSINPNLSATDLKEAILNSAEVINITIPDGTTQSVKKLNAYNAVKYVLSNSISVTGLNYNNKYLNKSIDSSSSIFTEKNHFTKLVVGNEYEYEFTIASSNPVEVTLYDSNFNVMNIDAISTSDGLSISFRYYLSLGTYYLKSNYISSNLSGTIYVTILGEEHEHSYIYEEADSGHIATCTLCDYSVTLSHIYDQHYCIYCNVYTPTHDYDSNYQWINYNKHSAECSCGETTTQGHVIDSDSYNSGQRYATCLLCGGLTNIGFIGWNINSTSVTKISSNGSFILSNGIIVLVDEDIEAYCNGTLVFYDKDTFILEI